MVDGLIINMAEIYYKPFKHEHGWILSREVNWTIGALYNVYNTLIPRTH